VLRSISQSFARIAELLGLIVETTLATLTENSSAHADQLYKLVPLKDGLAVTQQSILEVRGSSHSHQHISSGREIACKGPQRPA
jgi:hypothetical protein